MYICMASYLIYWYWTDNPWWHRWSSRKRQDCPKDYQSVLLEEHVWRYTCVYCLSHSVTNARGWVPKLVKSNAKLHPKPVQSQVWHQVSYDCISMSCLYPVSTFEGWNWSDRTTPPTRNGNKYVVTLFDYFSKWPEAVPLPDKSTFGVGMFLYELFCRYAYTVLNIYTYTYHNLP